MILINLDFVDRIATKTLITRDFSSLVSKSDEYKVVKIISTILVHSGPKSNIPRTEGLKVEHTHTHTHTHSRTHLFAVLSVKRFGFVWIQKTMLQCDVDAVSKIVHKNAGESTSFVSAFYSNCRSSRPFQKFAAEDNYRLSSEGQNYVDLCNVQQCWWWEKIWKPELIDHWNGLCSSQQEFQLFHSVFLEYVSKIFLSL